jgi:hypothetical protein
MEPEDPDPYAQTRREHIALTVVIAAIGLVCVAAVVGLGLLIFL